VNKKPGLAPVFFRPENITMMFLHEMKTRESKKGMSCRHTIKKPRNHPAPGTATQSTRFANLHGSLRES